MTGDKRFHRVLSDFNAPRKGIAPLVVPILLIVALAVVSAFL